MRRPDANARHRLSLPVRNDRRRVRGDRGKLSAVPEVLARRPARLATARLVLEPRGAEHAARLAAIMADPELYRFIPQEPPTRAALEARYRRTWEGPREPDERWWNWAVFAAGPHGAGIGTVELSLDVAATSASLAYLFGRAYWGAGYAFEACAAAIAHVRSATRLTRITANVDTRNARSIALVERLRFTRIATLENADVFDGAASDEFVYERSLRG